MFRVPPGNYISHIVVEQLYGEFSYEIGPVKEDGDPRVLILYGSNGTGKSTILQLLRSLLSPSNTSGHRNRIAQIPFKKFEVNFMNGQRISATREKDLHGSYLLSISGGGEGSGIRVFIKADSDGTVQTTKWSRNEQEQFQSFLKYLSRVSREVTFLDDKRTFSRILDRDRARLRARINRMAHEGYWTGAEDESEDPVSLSVDALVDSIRRESLLRQRRGSGDSQYIYKNLISTLASGSSSVNISIDDLVSRLRANESLSAELSEIGLISRLNNEDIVEQLNNVPPERRAVVTDLVGAYVKSTEAWFSALKEIKSLLDVFVDRLNFFMPQKSVSLTVSDGLNIISRNGKPLYISNLSSGERQLIMMLTQSLIRRNEAALIVIDEPELSLNMKWQRELVAAILECLGGGNSQVVFATHSIEIAARYRKNVMRLWAQGEDRDAKDD